MARWKDYWRKLFPKITTNDIDAFAATYRFSIEEREDLIKAYTSYKGDMKKVLNAVMCSSDEDLDRFIEMIKDEIESGKIKTFPKYSSFLKSHGMKKKKKPIRRRKKENDMDALRDAILRKQNTSLAKTKTKRQREFENLTEKLAEKYAKKKRKKKSKKNDAPPSEEEFLRLQSMMFGK